MEEFSIGSSPVVQSIELGSVEKRSLKGMEGPWRTVIMCQNIKRLSGKIPVFLQHPSPAGPDNKQTGGQRNQHTHTHAYTYFPITPLCYQSLPSIFVLIDFCGVRSY